MNKFVGLLALGLCFQGVYSACTWGYSASNGPGTAAWDGSCPTGMSGSPIDLNHDSTYVDDWLPFQFVHYDKKPRINTVTNNGHSAVVSFEMEGCDDNFPQMMQGNLPGTYEFAQYHFHWGAHHSLEGSEHTLYGKQTAAELHLVHYNIRCGRNLGDAIANCPSDNEALAVLGIMIEEGDYNPHFENLLDAFQYITADDASTHFKPTALEKLLPHDTNEFWRYSGSLTTPGCDELVVWTVFKNPIQMSKHQLEKMFQLQDCDGTSLVNNFRPTQPLNSRVVYFANLEFDCDNDFYWHKDEACNIANRETRNEFSFNSAVHACVGYHWGSSMRQGLIPVGKLRCLRNKYDYNALVMRPLDDHFCHRYFRVNGMKDEYGVWREYPSGDRISFSHFPEFNELKGDEGDTLIWDALQNRLYIDDEHDEYHAICYRQYQRDCEQCQGFENGHECSDAGDCLSGTCMCDVGFEGSSCQVAPLPDVDIVAVGGTDTEVYDSASDTSCTTATAFNSISSSLDGEMCDFVFGKGICCGGKDDQTDPTTFTSNDMCAFWDCYTDGWTVFEDMPHDVSDAAHNKVISKGRDIAWFVFGGTDWDADATGSTASDKVYMLDEKLRWTQVDTVMPTARSYACSVQISECEIAVIGGNDNARLSGVLTPTAVTDVDIFNYKTNTWRQAMYPSGTVASITALYASCGKIIDRQSFHKTIVVSDEDSTTNDILWDVSDNVWSDALFDANTGGNPNELEELDMNTLVGINTDSGSLYRLDLERGWTEIGSMTDGYDGGSGFVAPRRYMNCDPA